MNIWYPIITALLGFVGFWIADKIIRMKKKDEPIICPIGYDCDEVVRGPYSKFFGISTVKLGRIYYLIIPAFYILSLFLEMPRQLIFVAVLISGAALLFSIYLTILQLFVIKKWL